MLQVSIDSITFFFESGNSDGRMRCANSDSNNVRSLPVQISVIGGQYNNSVESCVEACGAGGFSLAGMEFAQECCTYRLF